MTRSLLIAALPVVLHQLGEWLRAWWHARRQPADVEALRGEVAALRLRVDELEGRWRGVFGDRAGHAG